MINTSIDHQTLNLSATTVQDTTAASAHRLPSAIVNLLPVLEDCVKSIEHLQDESSQFRAFPTYLRGAAVLASCHIKNGDGERAHDLCEQVFSYMKRSGSPLSDRVVSELLAPIYQAANESLLTRIAIRCEDFASKDEIARAGEAQKDRFNPIMAGLTKLIQPHIDRLNRHDAGAMEGIADTFTVWAGPNSPVSDGFNTVPFSFFYHAVTSIVPRIEDVGHKREFIGKLIELYRYQSPRNEDLDNIADACRQISKIAGIEVAEQINQWIPSSVTSKGRACRAIALGAIEANDIEAGEHLLKKSVILSFARLPQSVRSGLPLTSQINFDNQTLTRLQAIMSKVGTDSEVRCTLPLSLDLAQGMGAILKANATDHARFFGLLAIHVAGKLQASQHKQQFVNAFIDQFNRAISTD